MEPGHEPPSDNDLLQRCRHGDAEAFGMLYDRYGATLYGTALRLLADPARAEDVVQEAFLKLHSRPPQPPVANLGGWLHRVTSNAALDRLRRRQRRAEQELPDRPLRAVAPQRASGATADLQQAVDELPERGREVFLLHDVEGFKHREIAEMLGISEGTSKSQLFRTRQLLRNSLERGATGGTT